MIIFGFFICIWYLAGGIALYHKIFTSGVEYFGYSWIVLILGLTKFYTDEIFFLAKNSSEIHKISFALIINYAFVVIFFLCFESIRLPHTLCLFLTYFHTNQRGLIYLEVFVLNHSNGKKNRL